MNCQNCGSKLSCGCQKRVASDGKEVCSTCATNYEILLKQKAEAESLITKENKTNNT